MAQPMTVGLLKDFLSLYFPDTRVAVKVPGGEIYEITGTAFRSAQGEPLVFQLLTERDLELKPVDPKPIIVDSEPTTRDQLQP